MLLATKLFLTIIIIVSFVLYYRYIIVDNIYNLCSNYAYAYCTETSNNAIINSLDDTTKYTDLITIEKDNSGEIILMSANTLKINVISREIVKNCSISLNKKIENGIPVPLLAFTGIGLISGYGKNVNLKTLSVSSVLCDFLSDFKSVGINQTLHCIYVELTVGIDINLPLSNRNETIKTKVVKHPCLTRMDENEEKDSSQ